DSAKAAYVVGRYRPTEAFDLDLADRLGFHSVLVVGKHTLADQDLSCLCMGAQPRREVRDGAERPVVVTAFEPDPAQRGVAGSNADSEAKVGASLPPGIRELDEPRLGGERHPDRLECMVFDR